MVKAQRRARRLFHCTGREKMIEVGMGMEDMADGESELSDFVENLFVGPAGINHDGLLRHRIADDRTVASKRRDREGFANQCGHRSGMLPSDNLRAQAADPPRAPHLQ